MIKPVKHNTQPVPNNDRLSALVRIYRAASAVRDYQLEQESARQLLEKFGVVVPCQEAASGGGK